jgi:hypothetical protein
MISPSAGKFILPRSSGIAVLPGFGGPVHFAYIASSRLFREPLASG